MWRRSGPISAAPHLEPVPARAGETIQFPRRRVTLRARAAQRLAELYRLAAFSRTNGVFLDPDTWAFVLAATLACGKPGHYQITGRQRWVRSHGLDLLSLREAVQRCGFDKLGDDELAAKIHAVERWQSEHGVHLITGAKLGQML